MYNTGINSKIIKIKTITSLAYKSANMMTGIVWQACVRDCLLFQLSLFPKDKFSIMQKMHSIPF
jgi:hypothetical protein